MVRPVRKPLVVMSPKSLLRHPLAVSNLSELADGQFETVIPEIDVINNDNVVRLVLCGGKVYYDLLEQRRKLGLTDVAIVRIEQLYPFPHEDVKKALEPYAHVTDYVWCQEEPLNQGAWYYLAPELYRLQAGGLTAAKVVEPAARPAAAAPATGSPKIHQAQQKAVIAKALNVKVEELK